LLWRWQYTWQPQTNAGILLFFGLVLLFITSIFLGLLGDFEYRAHRLASEGKFATGTVVKKVMHAASNNGTSDTSYEVDYNFTTADGHQIEGNDKVNPDAWDQLKEGGSVQIEYAAGKPRINQVGATEGPSIIADIVLVLAAIMWLVGATLAVKGLLGPWSAPAKAGAAGSKTASAVRFGTVELGVPPFLRNGGPWGLPAFILFVCGAVFLLIGVANLYQERAFRNEGKFATAIVLTKSSRVEHDQQNNTYETHYDLGYRFTTDDGRLVRGSEEVSWNKWKSIHERDPIQIIYISERPWKNRLAADRPAFFLWFVAGLGAALTGGGTILLGYGLFGAKLKQRRRKSERETELTER
jgi:methionine-rich copper-binding protein CopC